MGSTLIAPVGLRSPGETMERTGFCIPLKGEVCVKHAALHSRTRRCHPRFRQNAFQCLR